MEYHVDVSEADRARLQVEKARKYLDVVVEVLQWKATLSLEEILMLNDERYKFQIEYLGLTKENYIKYLAISEKANELDKQFLLSGRDGKIYDLNVGDYMDKRTAYDRYCGGYAQAKEICERINEAKEQSTYHEYEIMKAYPTYGGYLDAVLGVSKSDYSEKANKIREQSRQFMDRLGPKDDDKGDQGVTPRRV